MFLESGPSASFSIIIYKNRKCRIIKIFIQLTINKRCYNNYRVYLVSALNELSPRGAFTN